MTWQSLSLRLTILLKFQKSILREYMALVAKGHHIKYGELVETLLDIEIWEQPKRKKVCQGRWVDLMSEERQVLGRGYSNVQIVYGALYDPDYPVMNEDSREGTNFWLDYDVCWEVFIKLIREFETRYQFHQRLRRLKPIPFKLRILEQRDWRHCAMRHIRTRRIKQWRHTILAS
jgi:hypothetical protein